MKCEIHHRSRTEQGYSRVSSTTSLPPGRVSHTISSPLTRSTFALGAVQRAEVIFPLLPPARVFFSRAGALRVKTAGRPPSLLTPCPVPPGSKQGRGGRSIRLILATPSLGPPRHHLCTAQMPCLPALLTASTASTALSRRSFGFIASVRAGTHGWSETDAVDLAGPGVAHQSHPAVPVRACCLHVARAGRQLRVPNIKTRIRSASWRYSRHDSRQGTTSHLLSTPERTTPKPYSKPPTLNPRP